AGVEPVVDDRYQHADVPGATRGQPRCGGRNHIAKIVGCLLDGGQCAGGDIAPTGERARNGRHGDASCSGYVLDAGHEVPSDAVVDEKVNRDVTGRDGSPEVGRALFTRLPAGGFRRGTIRSIRRRSAAPRAAVRWK